MIAPVMDCSVAAAWIIEDEASPGTDAVLDRVIEVGACAPDLWWRKLRNVLVVSERRGRLTEDKTARGLAEIGAWKCGSTTPPTVFRRYGSQGSIACPSTTRVIWSWPSGMGVRWPRWTEGLRQRRRRRGSRWCRN